MNWSLSDRFDPHAAALADRHYSRQTHGSPQFVKPGRCLVLTAPGPALWVTSWQDPQYVKHAWPGAWECSWFRREGGVLASTLITEAVAATRWKWSEVPDLGMVTFVNTAETRPKQDPGWCFLKAGFLPDGTTAGGLVALRLAPDDMPEPLAPRGSQIELWEPAA